MFVNRMVKFLTTATLLMSPKLAAAEPVLELSASNTVVMRSIFNDKTVSKVIGDMLEKDASLPKGRPIYLFLDSPGGSVEAGMLLIQTAKSLNRPVKTITYFGASMAFLTQQMLGTRYVMPYSIMMSHRVSGGVEGQQPGELDSRYLFWNNYQKEVMGEVATRLNMSLDDLNKKHVHEWWILGKNAVQDGVADKVVYVKCSKDLNGTVDESIPTIFGTVKVKWSQCPLNTAPISTSFGDIAYNIMNPTERRDFDKQLHLLLYNRKGFFNTFILKGKSDGTFLK